MNTAKINFITVPKVLAIHSYVVKRFGGSQGIRDLGLLEAAVARPQASFSTKHLYKTIFLMAAALFHSIINNHPFIDGNKRTALFSTGIFLKTNKIVLTNQHQVEVEFTVRVTIDDLSVEEIAIWLEDHSIKNTS